MTLLIDDLPASTVVSKFLAFHPESASQTPVIANSKRPANVYRVVQRQVEKVSEEQRNKNRLRDFKRRKGKKKNFMPVPSTPRCPMCGYTKHYPNDDGYVCPGLIPI